MPSSFAPSIVIEFFLFFLSFSLSLSALSPQAEGVLAASVGLSLSLSLVR